MRGYHCAKSKCRPRRPCLRGSVERRASQSITTVADCPLPSGVGSGMATTVESGAPGYTGRTSRPFTRTAVNRSKACSAAPRFWKRISPYSASRRAQALLGRKALRCWCR